MDNCKKQIIENYTNLGIDIRNKKVNCFNVNDLNSDLYDD